MERNDDIRDAIHRETRLKHLSRSVKVKMIEAGKPSWKDLPLGFGLWSSCVGLQIARTSPGHDGREKAGP